ncbi:hypothetical protein [uncultured Prevotella sp.]|jgi:hypothetical protein|uniref:hypothetical protein n=1 Tax=uncultured Prevotella sp. TaxID=159272 RepID=UPI00265D3C95|nr:hypothetical protein [uncultured Prevotella sp.]
MGMVKRLLYLIIPYIILSSLAGCKSVQYVPVETVRTDSIYVDRYQRDSIYQRDSVFVNRWIAGDTIYQDKVVWKYVYRDKVKYDTVAILRSDTINVPYPVECKLSKWEQLKLNVGGWAISIIIIIVLIVMGCMVYKLKK